MQQRQWRGPERRRSEGAYDGENRRRSPPGGYPADAGVNAEDPRTEQDESLLHRTRGPDPRKKIQPGERGEPAGGPGMVPRDQTDIH
jgi:hypothetical protein